jgi:hypothetical protein
MRYKLQAGVVLGFLLATIVQPTHSQQTLVGELPVNSWVPTGAILLIVSGTCPQGFTQYSGCDGKALIGTLAANGNVGTSLGSDTITPAGSVQQATFTGSALATHAHELPWQIPSTTTIRQIAVGTFGTGTSRAATAVSAAGTANTTSAAVALSQAVSAGTPAGTINAQSFTGTQFDNRQASLRVICCQRQ